jgi:hypothetical protein
MISDPTFLVSARMENGDVTVKVTATRTYGNRSISTTREISDKKAIAAVKAAFGDSVESVRAELSQESFGEAARAVTAAFDNKESIEGPRTIVRADKDGNQKAVKMKEEG